MPAFNSLLLALWCILLSLSAHAADASPEPRASAELRIANRTVMVFHAPLAGYTPRERAEVAERRLDKATSRPGAQRPSTRTLDEGTQVLLDGEVLFLVTPADINALAGDTTETVAADSARRLAQALQDRRDQGSVRQLAIAGALCLLATALYAGLLHGVTVLHRTLRERTVRLLGARLARARVPGLRLLDAEHYLPFVHLVGTLLAWALRLLLTFVWAAFVLARLPYTRGWGERLSGHLLATAADAAQATANALPGLLLVVVTAAVARLAMATTTSVFRRMESGQVQGGWLDPETAAPRAASSTS